VPDEKRRPELVSELLARFLDKRGLAKRVEQSSVIPEWASLVGEQLAIVTQPLSVTADATLFVAVKSHAWMTELTFMERDLLARLNERTGESPIRKIRWQLMR
jgi:predicted nucleic acid-binding Zn ribbon protein